LKTDHILRIALLALSLSALCAQAQVAVSNVFRYANPLNFSYPYFDGTRTNMHEELRDPCIIRDGDTYYLVFTMFPFRGRDERHLSDIDMGSPPGIQMFSTRDFKTWKTEGWLVKSSELPVDCTYKHRFWAPEIHKAKGKFYLIFTADNWVDPKYNLDGKWGMYTHIGVSDKVTGPYEHITRIPYGPCDGTFFCDTNGTFYTVMPKGEIFIQTLDLSELEKGNVRRTGEEKRIVTKSNADIGAPVSTTYLEGPWLEKIGSQYTLFYAAPYPDRSPDPDFRGYWVGAAYADTVMGPYHKDPRGKVFFGGHIAVFDGPDGRKWFSYRWERDNRARGRLCIDAMDFDKDGHVQATDHLGEVTVSLR
jgi:beta-xylosidase